MTAAREAAEFAEALAQSITAVREAAEFAEALAHPTTRTREAAVFAEALVGGRARSLDTCDRDDFTRDQVTQIGAAYGNTGTFAQPSVPMNYPVGIQVDDLMVATSSSFEAFGGPPAGWTELVDMRTGSGAFGVISTQVFYKWVEAGDPGTGIAFPNPGNNRRSVLLAAWRNVDRTNPFRSRVMGSFTASTNVVCPSATSGGAGDRLICLVNGGNYNNFPPYTYGVPGSMVEVGKVASANYCSSMIGQEVMGGAGATGTRTITTDAGLVSPTVRGDSIVLAYADPHGTPSAGVGRTQQGRPWVNLVPDTRWAIDAGRVYAPDCVHGSTAGTILVADFDAADCVIQLDIPAIGNDSGGNGTSGPAWRVADADHWFLAIGNRVYRNIGAGSAPIVFGASQLADGDHLKIVLNGTRHTIYRNGVLWADFTSDDNLTFTRHGLQTGDAQFNAARFDNFEVCPIRSTLPIVKWPHRGDAPPVIRKHGSRATAPARVRSYQ